jgi:hypothetical protein
VDLDQTKGGPLSHRALQNQRLAQALAASERGRYTQIEEAQERTTAGAFRV